MLPFVIPCSYYNIYRNGEPAEAVSTAADAAFAALAFWLSEQQAIVEKQFLMERDRLRRIFEAEKEAALAALRAQLETEFEAKLSDALSKLRYELEVEKHAALEKLRAEAAAATAAALAKLEERLKTEAEAAQAALRCAQHDMLLVWSADAEAILRMRVLTHACCLLLPQVHVRGAAAGAEGPAGGAGGEARARPGDDQGACLCRMDDTAHHTHVAKC